MMTDTPPRTRAVPMLTISVGASRKATAWLAVQMTWADFTKRLARVKRTDETHATYLAMSKDAQAATKDVGGYLAGALIGERRTKHACRERSMVVLDGDHADKDYLANAWVSLDYAWAIHTTRSHTPAAPRFRHVIPTNRGMSPTEYVAVSRWCAGQMGIEQFDHTTHDPQRLMYWPSASSDQEWIFEVNDGDVLDVDSVLASYGPDDAWTDTTLWPRSSRETKLDEKDRGPAADPRTKPGWVGAFNRVYSIVDAILKYLPDVYTPTGVDNRWTHEGGKTSGGLVIYSKGGEFAGGDWAYSHHATDPAEGKSLNAFDLVRVHLHGALDEDADEDTPVTALPSHKAMVATAAADPAVAAEINRPAAGILDDFDDVSGGNTTPAGEGAPAPARDPDWASRLDRNNKGDLKPTLNTVTLLLRHRPELWGALGVNDLSHRLVLFSDVPWRKLTEPERAQGRPWGDEDTIAARLWLERTDGLRLEVTADRLNDAASGAAKDNHIHPVRDYLGGLVWDGVPRVETMFCRHLGAEDTPLVRAIARKFMAAAVSRVRNPGCKWDYMVVLVGEQGLRKSMFWDILGKGWYSDSVSAMHGKDGYESLMGIWIAEAAELSAWKRSEIEVVKQFVTKRIDSFRPAYGRHKIDYYRQCVLVGTTNNRESLADATGNRRFWMVDVTRRADHLALMAEVDQLWAEAVVIREAGEQLWLEDPTLEADAARVAEEHRSTSGVEALIAEWLDKPVPEGWSKRSAHERMQAIRAGMDGLEGPTELRDRVRAHEVWMECLGGDAKTLTRIKAQEINEAMRRMPGWIERKNVRFGNEKSPTRGFLRVQRGRNEE